MDLFDLSINNEEIVCYDKFIGDENCNLICEKILSNDSSYSNIIRFILRGNCLGTFYLFSTRSSLSSRSILNNMNYRSTWCTINLKNVIIK